MRARVFKFCLHFKSSQLFCGKEKQMLRFIFAFFFCFSFFSSLSLMKYRYTDDNFVSLSSWIKMPTKWKLGIHVDNILMSSVQISPRKKALSLRFAAEHPLHEIFFFAEKNKNHLFRRRFSPRNLAEEYCGSSRRNSARFCGEIPRNFAIGR